MNDALNQKIGSQQAVVLRVCEKFRHCSRSDELLNIFLDGVIELGHARARLWIYQADGRLKSFGCRGPHSIATDLNTGAVLMEEEDAAAQRVITEQRTLRFRYRPLDYHSDETSFPWIDATRQNEMFHDRFDKAGIEEWTEVPLYFGGANFGKVTVDNLGSNARFNDADVLLLDHMAGVASTVLRNLESIQKHQESKAYYESLVQRFPFCVFAKDLKGRFTFANSTLVQYFGAKTEAEILGETDGTFFSPELAEKFKKGDEHAIAHGFYEDKNEVFVVPRTKERLVIHVIKVSLTDRNGEPIGLQGAFWDVSDRNLALQKTQEIASIGSWILSLPRQTVEASDELYRIFGLNPQDKAVNLTYMRSRIYQPDRAIWDKLFAATKLAKPMAVEIRIEVNGDAKWIFAKSETLRSHTGEALKVIGIVQDIDRTKRSKEILSRAAIACTGVHNLKDPVTLLRNAIETLRYKNHANEALSAELGEIEGNATKFIENIDHLIKVFKEGKPALRRQKISLEEFLRARVIRANVDATSKGVTIDEHYGSGAAPISVDLVLLRHVLENLFTNAIRHTARGGQISVRTIPKTTAVEVTLSNTGPAFDPEVLSDFKLSCSPKDPKGTGLGLLISKAILELHDGTLIIDNDEKNQPVVSICLNYETSQNIRC